MNHALIEEWVRTLAPPLATVAVAMICYQVVRRWTRLFARGGLLSFVMALRLRRIALWFLSAGTVLALLQQLGFFDEAWALLSAIIAALAVGFVASWSLLSNASCALLLLVYRPFRVGDEIELLEPSGEVGVKGRVMDLNLFFTSLLDAGDAVVRIPNNVFVQKYCRVQRGGRPPNPARDSVGPFFTLRPGELLGSSESEPQRK